MQLTTGQTLRGLIGASGAGGRSDGNSDDWFLVVHLAAWRIDGHLSQGMLRCEMPVTKTELTGYMHSLAPYAVVTATVTATTLNGTAMVEAVSVFDGADDDLRAIKEALLLPILLDIPHMGILAFNRRLEGYTGDAIWRGQKVIFTLFCSDPHAPDAVLAHAAELHLADADWDASAKAFTADQLVTLRNENWTEDGDPDLSSAEFIARMTLAEIWVYEDGNLTFWYDDGDLFWGHSINVSGNVVDGWQTAGI